MKLTPQEEHALYLIDRMAWSRYVAPNWKTMLETASPEAKRALWALAGPELREALHELKQSTKEAA